MLIDLLLAGPNDTYLSQVSRDLLTKATRFVMQEDFAMATDQLSQDTDTVIKALAFCRLPFPVCWLEFAQADREKDKELPYDALTEVHPVRVGWLLQQINVNGSWRAEMYWSFDPAAEKTFMVELVRTRLGRIGTSGATSALLFDITKLSSGDMEQMFSLERAFGAAIAERVCQEMMGFMPETPPGFYTDWQGEPRFLAAALALMNSKNAAESIKVAIPDKVNARRRREGKLPFLDYHVLRIPGRYKQKHVADGEITGHQLRAHFVRGHYKVRRTGVFFWSTFQRGNPMLGFVHKNYTLRLPETEDTT